MPEEQKGCMWRSCCTKDQVLIDKASKTVREGKPMWTWPGLISGSLWHGTPFMDDKITWAAGNIVNLLKETEKLENELNL